MKRVLRWKVDASAHWEMYLRFSQEHQQCLLKGLKNIPKVTFLHDPGSKFPTASTCALWLCVPTCHTSYSKFKECMVLAMKSNEGFAFSWSAVLFPCYVLSMQCNFLLIIFCCDPVQNVIWLFWYSFICVYLQFKHQSWQFWVIWRTVFSMNACTSMSTLPEKNVLPASAHAQWKDEWLLTG